VGAPLAVGLEKAVQLIEGPEKAMVIGFISHTQPSTVSSLFVLGVQVVSMTLK